MGWIAVLKWLVYFFKKRPLLKSYGYTLHYFHRDDGSVYKYWQGIGRDWKGDKYEQTILHSEVITIPISYLKQRIGVMQ